MKPPYQITDKILSLITSISEKIGEINAAHLQRPSPELRKKNRIRTIQSSLGIEGNTLTIEQVTTLLENKRVLGPKKDILEVKNALGVYEMLDKFRPDNLKDFCKAHAVLMHGLVDSPGKLRTQAVGIVKGKKLAHLAPPSSQVKPLMNDLFDFLKKDKEIVLIKSCVFHYELEFIHPFTDGNGRIGRLWQTVILKEKYPVFEFLPLETIIKEKQQQYYSALSKSDKEGHSTGFIEFMLDVINEALEELLRTTNVALTAEDRIASIKDIFGKNLFTRQDYLRHFKGISTATASRDLRMAVESGMLKRTGNGRISEYKVK